MLLYSAAIRTLVDTVRTLSVVIEIPRLRLGLFGAFSKVSIMEVSDSLRVKALASRYLILSSCEGASQKQDGEEESAFPKRDSKHCESLALRSGKGTEAFSQWEDEPTVLTEAPTGQLHALASGV